MYDKVLPSMSFGIMPCTHVPFILTSNLSRSTRKNSWASCCIKVSNVSHPKLLVSFFVPTAFIIEKIQLIAIELEIKLVDKLVIVNGAKFNIPYLRTGGHEIHVAMREQHF